MITCLHVHAWYKLHLFSALHVIVLFVVVTDQNYFQLVWVLIAHLSS